MSILIHIGYPKCGSTLIRQWLSAHPLVSYQKDSILGFQKPEDISLSAFRNENIPQHFAISEEDLSFWPGDLDPVGVKLKPYSVKKHQKNVCQILNQMFPTGRILLITRGFEGILISAYSQYLKAGGVLEFINWMDEYKDIQLDFFDYDYLVQLYIDAFGKDQVCILPFELLKDSPKEFIQRIANFAKFPEITFELDIANPSLNPGQMKMIQKQSLKKYKAIRRLPYPLQLKKYHKYVQQMVVPQIKKGESENLMVDRLFLHELGKRATFVRDLSLFEPYIKEYIVEANF